MYAFGHIMLALYVIHKLTRDLKKTLILAPLTLIPDIDLVLKIEHRGILHSILIIPLFIISVFALNKILKLNLDSIKMLVISLLLYLLHIFADTICGYVMIFPGIYIGTSCHVTATIDFLFGFVFYVLFLLDLKLKGLGK